MYKGIPGFGKFGIMNLHNSYLFSTNHYNDVIMSVLAYQITSLAIVCSIVYSSRRSEKTSKVRVTGLYAGLHRWPVNYQHKGPVTRKMFPFDDVLNGF